MQTNDEIVKVATTASQHDTYRMHATDQHDTHVRHTRYMHEAYMKHERGGRYIH